MTDDLTIWKVRESLIRRWKTVVALTAIGALGALIVTFALPEVYEARTRVVLATTDADAVETAAIEAHSDALATTVMEATGFDGTITDFFTDTSVDAVTESVLEFRARADSPTQATETAQLLATEFIAAHTENIRARSAIAIDSLERRAVALEGELADVQQELNIPTSAAREGALLGLQDQLRSAITVATDTAETLRVESLQQIGGTRVVLNATEPDEPLSPSLTINLFLGLFAGAAAAVVLVMLGETSRRRLRRRGEIADAIGAPVLGSVERTRRERWVARCSDGLWPRLVADIGRSALHLAPPGERQIVLVSAGCDLETAAFSILLADLAGRSGCETDVFLSRRRDAEQLGHLLADAGLVEDRESTQGYGTLRGEPGGSDVDWFPHSNETMRRVDRTRLRIVTSSFEPNLIGALALDHLDDGPRAGFILVRSGAVTLDQMRFIDEELRAQRVDVVGAIVVDPDRFDDSSGRSGVRTMVDTTGDVMWA
jgi:capsular polysaccharide biosynthesis protein